MRYRVPQLLQSRSRILTLLLILGLAVGIPFYAALWYAQYGPASPDLQKYLAHHYPYLSSSVSHVDAPTPILSLLASESPLLHPPPNPLPLPTCAPIKSLGQVEPSKLPPLLLSLHIFSNARFNAQFAKLRRNIIRRTILMGVPHMYRHLVEVKFIMGRSWDPAQETLHDREEKNSGDMIRLSMPDGDGERGKAAEWMRLVGGQRVAQWVV